MAEREKLEPSHDLLQACLGKSQSILVNVTFHTVPVECDNVIKAHSLLG